MAQNDTKLWTRYQAGLDYMRRNQFTDKWPEYERFKASEQWPELAENSKVKALPRLTLNIIKYIINNKKANVLSQTLKMEYRPNDMPDEKSEDYTTAAADMTAFAAQTWYRLHQDELNDMVVDDAETYGCGFWHYFWDNNVVGGTDTKFVGALDGEVIDPSSVFFGNPEEWDVQKQPYVLVASREDVDLLKERLRGMVDADGNRLVADETIDRITKDGGDTDIQVFDKSKHRDDDNNVTVLTQYFRKNGEMHMERATKSVTFQPATRMNGNRKYPIVALPWNRRKRCIYGTSEVAGLIPMQRALNLIYSMLTMSVELTGWPTLLVYNGATGDKVTNIPGQIIQNQLSDPNAIKYLDPPQLNGAVFTIADKLVEYVRTFSGVTEVLTGDRIASDMAAGAIIAIQNANKQPLVEFQKRLYRAIKDVGEVWEEFFKNYHTMPVPMMVEAADGKRERREFVGANYAEITFDLNVDVGPASDYEEQLAVSTLDRFLDRGDITMQQYVQLAPRNAAPFRDRLLSMVGQSKTDALLAAIQGGVMQPDALQNLIDGGMLSEDEATGIMQQLMDAQQEGAQAQETPQEQAGEAVA